MVLALLGGALALALTQFSMHIFKATFLTDIWNPLKVDWRVLVFTFAIAAFCGIVFGLAPAIQASVPDLNRALQQGGRSGTRGQSFRMLGRILVAGEVTLAVALLAIGGDMILSFVRLRTHNPGFNPSNLLTARVSLPDARYAGMQFHPFQRVTATLDSVSEHIATLPGVQGVAYTTVLPRSESDPRTRFYRPDQRVIHGGEAPVASWRAVSANYFDVLGIPLLEGRKFTQYDRFGLNLAVIVSKSLAERNFGGESAVGKRIFVFDEPRLIVGVVGDVLLNRSSTAPATIYLPHHQSPRINVSFLVRTAGDPQSIANSLSAKVWEVDRDQPVSNIMTFDEYADLQFSGRRMTTSLLTGFCVLAIVLAVVGLYGLTSYLVSQRSKEFGIRVAMGAASGDIFGVVMREALAVAGAGAIAGLVTVVIVRQTLQTWFAGILQSQWWMTAVVAGILLLIAALASLLPAVRATSIDTAVLLRES